MPSMRPFRQAILFVALPAAALVAFTLFTLGPRPRTAFADSASGADYLGRLRYIGRDTTTGLPAPVDDRFIASVAREVERYGQDRQQPEPPPPPGPVDIRTLAIPRVGVSAPVGRFGVDNYGRLDVPQDRRTVGWNPGYADLPGTGGSTFFAAHFEYGGLPGVFNKLSTLQAGDLVSVSLSDGSIDRYRVTSVIDYTIGQIDMGALLQGREGLESITLMTCSGPPNAAGYPMRTVVLAERAD